jgi:hypothetical protein
VRGLLQAVLIFALALAGAPRPAPAAPCAPAERARAPETSCDGCGCGLRGACCGTKAPASPAGREAPRGGARDEDSSLVSVAEEIGIAPHDRSIAVRERPEMPAFWRSGGRVRLHLRLSILRD